MGQNPLVAQPTPDAARTAQPIDVVAQRCFRRAAA
jgi:hypothetical protein